MKVTTIIPGEEINLFVRNILVFEEKANQPNTVLPFFADGYPGLLFHQTNEGLWVQPQDKKMPDTFLYGQTLHPIELHIKGTYKLILFQFYPFVLNSFFGVDARELNDNCYDLKQAADWHEAETSLKQLKQTHKQVKVISQYLLGLFLNRKDKLDFMVKSALEQILARKAQVTVKELCLDLHVTPRTFERRFLKEVGVSPKDFIQIIRFQQSLEQLSVRDFNKLTDIVYANGFADQSHFIRVFKAFTGKTPTALLKD